MIIGLRDDSSLIAYPPKNEIGKLSRHKAKMQCKRFCKPKKKKKF